MKIKTRWLVLSVFLVLFVVGKAPENTRSSDPVLPSDRSMPILKDTPACHDDALLARLQKYSYERDDQALSSAAAMAEASGECMVLKTGTLVFFEDRRFVSGLVQVRAQGSTAMWWVPPSALKAGQ